jgi:hypothetical protein
MTRSARVVLGLGMVGLVGACTLAACSSCRGGAGAREDIALLPPETAIVVTVNAARMRNTAMWRKLLDLRDQTPEGKKKFDDFVARCGIDPFRQVDAVTLGFPAGERAEGEFGVVVRGTFDEQKLVACAREESQKQGHELTVIEHGGKKLYTDNGQIFAGLVDSKTLLFGGKEWAPKMVDLATSKTPAPSAKDDPRLAALIRKVRTGDAVWGVGVVPEAVRAKLQEMRELSASKTLQDLYASADFATGLAFQGVLDLGAADDAKELAAKLGEQIAEAKKSPQVLVMGLAPMLDAVQVSAEGTAFKVSVKYNQSQVDQLIERLQGLFKGGLPGAAGLGQGLGGP